MPSTGTTASRLPILLGLLAVLAAGAAGLAVYLRVTGEDRPVIQQGTSYTEALVGTWQRVNPLFTSENPVDADLSAIIFSGLVRVGSNGQAEPDLADLPLITEGGRTYTFTLREGARWHDGEPVTSSDVLFTLEAITAVGFRGPSDVASLWSAIEVIAPDDRTVVLRLPEANAPFLVRNATIGILPAHLLNGLSPQELYDAPFNSAPVGTGPYRITTLSTSEARLEANANYHLGSPQIEELRFRFFPEYGMALRAMENNEVEGIFFRDIPTAGQSEQVAMMGDITAAVVSRSAFLPLYLNNDAAELFGDPQVRRAISLAIDRGAIAEAVYGENAIPSASPISPHSWAYDPGYDEQGVDLDEARQLLDDAGWVVSATTGTRVRLGSEFRFVIRVDDDPARVQVAQLIVEQLEPLGIRASVASTSFTVLRRDFLQERRYQAAIAGWVQGPDPDPYFGWHSSQMGSAGANIANHSDAVADRLIEEGRQSTDPATREDMYRQFQEVWSNTVPSIVIAYTNYTYARTSGVEIRLPEMLNAPSQRFSFVHEWRR